MSATEWGLVIALVGEAVAVILAIVRLTAWCSSQTTELRVRLERAEHDIANDVLGRKAIAQALTDIATIKAQLGDVRDELRHVRDLCTNQGGQHE